MNDIELRQVCSEDAKAAVQIEAALFSAKRGVYLTNYERTYQVCVTIFF